MLSGTSEDDLHILHDGHGLDRKQPVVARSHTDQHVTALFDCRAVRHMPDGSSRDRRNSQVA